MPDAEQKFYMSQLILSAKELARELGEHRSSSLENRLSKIFRSLEEAEQSEVVAQLIGANVRVAAIAARGGLSVAQQLILLQRLLKSDQTNTLKVMVNDVFAHRMPSRFFVRALEENRSQYPANVNLAAYHFLNAGEVSSKDRDALRAMLEATRPTTRA